MLPKEVNLSSLPSALQVVQLVDPYLGLSLFPVVISLHLTQLVAVLSV